MRNYRKAPTALLGLTVWTSLASGQQKADATRESKGAAQGSRVCALEHGLNVCRDAGPAPRGEVAGAQGKPGSVTVVGAPKEKGKLLLLLDIPSNIFARLADSPESNRKYHPTTTREYRPEAPAPADAGKYVPMVAQGPPVWRYQPKQSFQYQPKRDWSYNRDVFGRLWRQNIQHDTRVAVVPVENPGVYLMPVADAR